MSLIEMLETIRAGFAVLFWLGVTTMLLGCLFLCVLPVFFS